MRIRRAKAPGGIPDRITEPHQVTAEPEGKCTETRQETVWHQLKLSYTDRMLPRWLLPWLMVLLAAVGFLVADRVWDFQFGLRTYWPVLVVLYLVARLALESGVVGSPPSPS